ncbi:hypothetical protein COO60DRAFT_578395 [Scenedesmus sp. NREL 46B-D3]|nr:hypothetical protein COO60DRAFT_578395 [Scenedesmus sp. NREL 46B-D3]
MRRPGRLQARCRQIWLVCSATPIRATLTSSSAADARAKSILVCMVHDWRYCCLHYAECLLQQPCICSRQHMLPHKTPRKTVIWSSDKRKPCCRVCRLLIHQQLTPEPAEAPLQQRSHYQVITALLLSIPD